MKSRLTRAVAMTAALVASATAVVLSSGSAQAAFPAFPAVGELGLSVDEGTATTPIGLINPATGNGIFYCDNATHQILTFMIPASYSPATIQWGAQQPQVNYTGTTTTEPYSGLAIALFSGGGLKWSPVVSIVEDSGPFIGQYAAVSSLGTVDFSVLGEFVPEDTYNIGAACVSDGVNTEKYWSTVITVDSADPSFHWHAGVPEGVPTAPTVTAVTKTATDTVSVAFNEVVANPEVDTYTVTIYDTDGTTVLATSAGTDAGSPIVVTDTDLVNRPAAYFATVYATSTAGDSPESALFEFFLGAGAQPMPVLNVAQGANAGELVASWNTLSGETPTSFTLTWTVFSGTPDPELTPAPPSPITGITGNSQTVTGLTPGVVYEFQVTALYADPTATATPSALVTGSPASDASLQQVIQVTRPAGALILTQRCGVHAELPAEVVDAGFPGFPAVGLIPANAAPGFSPDPTLDPAYPYPVTPGEEDDDWDDYPFADNTKTRCIIPLGTASLLTSGDLAGQYYAADGALNQVTVVDTRQGDNGWTVTGSIPELTNGGSNPDDSFSGDLVGWTPYVTDVTTGVYTQVVTEGDVVVPGTAAGLSAPAGQTLASAEPGEGLGVAVLDARIKVLIPVSNANGLYAGILTLNAA